MLGFKKNIFERLLYSNRNLIINGDISSGKTSNVIFPLLDRIIDNDESFLFLDSKKEYINKYYGYLKNKDYNVIIINLQDLDRSFGWNHLDYPYTLYINGNKEKDIEYLESLSVTIFDDNNNDSFWTSSAQCSHTRAGSRLHNPELHNIRSGKCWCKDFPVRRSCAAAGQSKPQRMQAARRWRPWH